MNKKATKMSAREMIKAKNIDLANGNHIAEQYDIEKNGVIEQLEWKMKNL